VPQSTAEGGGQIVGRDLEGRGGGRGPDPRVGERRAARAAGGKREGEKGRGGSVEASISCERGGQVRSQSKAVAVVKRKPIRLNFFLISDPKAKPLQ
jgi:hypothetical protein